MGQQRIFTVSFTEPEGICHSVDVSASTLYEAAVFAVAEFCRARLFDVHVGPGTWLRVAVKQPEAANEIQFGKLQEWLAGGARSPNEQMTKARLRKGIGRLMRSTRVLPIQRTDSGKANAT